MGYNQSRGRLNISHRFLFDCCCLTTTTTTAATVKQESMGYNQSRGRGGTSGYQNNHSGRGNPRGTTWEVIKISKWAWTKCVVKAAGNLDQTFAQLCRKKTNFAQNSPKAVICQKLADQHMSITYKKPTKTVHAIFVPATSTSICNCCWGCWCS